MKSFNLLLREENKDRISSQYNTGQRQYNSLLMTPKAKKTASKKAPAPAPKPVDLAKAKHPLTICIDIGGSGLKAMVLDANGKPVSDRQRVHTPKIPTPRAVLKGLEQLRELSPHFDRVSVGFPGVIKHGCTYLGFNLHPLWAKGFPLQKELEKMWHKPVRVGNDADVAGYGAIKGKGVELVLTLGTGMGAALFVNGHLVPGLELGHHPWMKKTYEDYLGRRGLDKFGKNRWNTFVLKGIYETQKLFNWDHLYIGGGNTKKLNFKLPPNVSIISNAEGILGGVLLWKDQG
jgi:polyphosphate glucokinase